MNWLFNFLKSTIGNKLIMALSGIFLILFLVIHLIGNLQLLKNDGGSAFNYYAHFMSSNPFIQFISKINFIIIIGHAVVALILTLHNRWARGRKKYVVTNTKSSSWTSRNMGILGTLILVFIVIHIKHFYMQMHYGVMPTVLIEGKEYSNLYTVVDEWFNKGWYVILYVFCMAAIGFHLWHGFSSAFQTLGLNHVKYNTFINIVGRTFALLIPALYALIPVYMYWL